MKHLFLLLFIITISIEGYTQGSDNTINALKSKAIGKTIKQKQEYGTSAATYLGIISVNGSRSKYYVVKEFSTLQAANVPHGHSRILFFDNQRKLVAEVELEMPEELPTRINGNALLFTYSENGVTKKYAFRMNNKQTMLCVQPNSCYEIVYK